MYHVSVYLVCFVVFIVFNLCTVFYLKIMNIRKYTVLKTKNLQTPITGKHHHHHRVHEGLGVFPVPWSSRCSWSLLLFLSRPTFLRPFGLYCSACFGSLFVSILCTCCNHFFWYCFISFTMFCAPVFSLIHWFFSISSLVIHSKCLKNLICSNFRNQGKNFVGPTKMYLVWWNM